MIYIHHISYIYIYVYIYIYIYTYDTKNKEINNCILQFLKNEIKTFLVLQKIFYSLYI